MSNTRKYFVGVFALGLLAVVATVLGMLFLSERFGEAGTTNLKVENAQIERGSSNSAMYVQAIERLRNEYAGFRTVELTADVTIQIFKENSTVAGTGSVAYFADGNKYRYSCVISNELQKEGLMRNVDIMFDGNKFFFNDKEARIVSYQSSEEVRLPSALPNPFFLPLEFLSNDDDGCEGCKMRLQDVNQPIRWPNRSSTISEITTESQNGAVNNLVKMEGGKLNGTPYDFRVRLIGETETMQPVSVTRVKSDGSPLVEIFLNDQRFVSGSKVRIPHQIEVGARDETGRVVLRAVYVLKSLKINQALANESFSRAFPDTDKYWNSDTKEFTIQP